MTTDATDEDDPFAESSEGETPNGGVGSVIRYQDDEGNPTRKSVATRAEIVEVDAKGEPVHRTYMQRDPAR